MIYIPKPYMVEACRFDSQQAALEWLRPGEFSVVQRDSISIRTEGSTHTNVPLDGTVYVARTDSEELMVIPREEFERVYVPLAKMDECAFIAEGDPGTGWVISCTICGPIGHVLDEEMLPGVGMEHVTEKHSGAST